MDDLSIHKFLYLGGDAAALYENANLFGHEVAKKFVGSNEDIEEAAKCLALGRGTACVFHLMRVMEYAVQRFAANVGAELPADKKIIDMEWGPLIIAINKVVSPMPPGEKRERYASISAHLDSVGRGWRNPTMHPKQTYTSDEARVIWDAVKAFMNDFAKIYGD